MLKLRQEIQADRPRQCPVPGKGPRESINLYSPDRRYRERLWASILEPAATSELSADMLLRERQHQGENRSCRVIDRETNASARELALTRPRCSNNRRTITSCWRTRRAIGLPKIVFQRHRWNMQVLPAGPRQTPVYWHVPLDKFQISSVMSSFTAANIKKRNAPRLTHRRFIGINDNRTTDAIIVELMLEAIEALMQDGATNRACILKPVPKSR